MLVRCAWAMGADPLMREYHDTEWGRELHGEVALFERLSLEAFQSGLSWSIILRKREAFRRAFAGFDPEAVAAFGAADIERLLNDAEIVRNRRKIEATISNARAVLSLDADLDSIVWSFRPTSHPAPRTMADVPAATAQSTALAKELKRRGFAFVGPTTAYALMQAAGLVNDHLADCIARPIGRCD